MVGKGASPPVLATSTNLHIVARYLRQRVREVAAESDAKERGLSAPYVVHHLNLTCVQVSRESPLFF